MTVCVKCKKKSPYEYGVPYRYGDACTRMVILSIWVLIYTYPGNHEYCFYVGPCKRQKYMIVLMRKVDITNIDVIVCTKKIVPQGKYLCFFTQPEITRQINLELTNIDYYRIKYEITRI